MKVFSMIATGHVQGVGFRNSVQLLANKLGITGTVKNNPDGSVSIVAQGTDQQLDEFIQAIKKGPSLFAEVSNLNLTEETDIKNYSKFSILG